MRVRAELWFSLLTWKATIWWNICWAQRTALRWLNFYADKLSCFCVRADNNLIFIFANCFHHQVTCGAVERQAPETFCGKNRRRLWTKVGPGLKTARFWLRFVRNPVTNSSNYSPFPWQEGGLEKSRIPHFCPNNCKGKLADKLNLYLV